MSLTKGAPHPNAGKLLFEFILSPEGQGLVSKAGELPVSPDVAPVDPSLRPSPNTFSADYLTPEQVDAALPQWKAAYDQYFR